MHDTSLVPVSTSDEGDFRASASEGSSCEQQIVALLEQVLLISQESCTDLSAPAKRRRGRPATVSLEQLWLALLLGVLRQKQHLSSIWRILFEQRIGSFLPVKLTYEAIRKRLLAAGSAPLQALFLRISAALGIWVQSQHVNALPLAPFACGIYALDESTMEQLRSVVPNDPHLIPGKIAGLFDLRKQCWIHMQFRADVLAGCCVDILLLVQGLAPGSLILADLGYFRFPWFDYLTGEGYFWVSRLKHRVTYSVKEVLAYDDHLGVFDAIVWLGKYRADQAAHAVRLVIYCHQGKQYVYLTNVLDPALLSMQEVAQLYARRWDIELAFKVLKREVGLCLWWGACPHLVMIQVWIALILAKPPARLALAGGFAGRGGTV